MGTGRWLPENRHELTGESKGPAAQPARRRSDAGPLKIGTKTCWGKVVAIGNGQWLGERYYWLMKDDHTIAMLPAIIIEPIMRAAKEE